MDPMNLLGYLMIFLFIAIGNAVFYSRLKEWRINRLNSLESDLKEMEMSYNKLADEVKEAQSKESRLKAELLDARKTAAREDDLPKDEKDEVQEKKLLKVIDILKKEGIVDEEKLGKARNYIEKSDNTGLKTEDALVLLGLVSSGQLKKAKKKAGGTA